MDSTCDPKNCKLFDLIGGTPEQCPNFQESWWTPEGKGKPILIKDCSPRRIFLMIQDLHNRLIGVQKAQEEQRNENVWVQVVAEVLGSKMGVDLGAFVEKRQQLQNAAPLKIEEK